MRNTSEVFSGRLGAKTAGILEWLLACTCLESAYWVVIKYSMLEKTELDKKPICKGFSSFFSRSITELSFFQQRPFRDRSAKRKTQRRKGVQSVLVMAYKGQIGSEGNFNYYFGYRKDLLIAGRINMSSSRIDEALERVIISTSAKRKTQRRKGVQSVLVMAYKGQIGSEGNFNYYFGYLRDLLTYGRKEKYEQIGTNGTPKKAAQRIISRSMLMGRKKKNSSAQTCNLAEDVIKPMCSHLLADQDLAEEPVKIVTFW
uniref:Transposase n=1 Tax=Steinernema glaseri TaxID=37863 RepID=A0A1I7ZGT5_9BILA